ncbi:MAG: hypothetical protein PHV34_10385 [Verrucomicrobiae bacterium]|nr:hypothetical protein [Verrucomicrobiae bacterium]
MAANHNRKGSFLYLVMTAMAALILLASCGNDPVAANRRNCQRQLKQVWQAIECHREKHGGQYPASLDAIRQEMPGWTAACPGRDGKSDSGGDYFYLNWSELAGKDGKVRDHDPLLYDRRLAHHGGKGICVLRVDGSVRWDKDARWLKRFARERPSLKIPLPE